VAGFLFVFGVLFVCSLRVFVRQGFAPETARVAGTAGSSCWGTRNHRPPHLQPALFEVRNVSLDPYLFVAALMV
jgi:hypothetical protein